MTRPNPRRRPSGFPSIRSQRLKKSLTRLSFAVAFSPDGQTVAAGSADDMIRLLNLDVQQAIDRICATTGENLTPEQWGHYIPPVALRSTLPPLTRYLASAVIPS